MSEEEKRKCPNILALLSFLVGTAVGVGIVLMSEKKIRDDDDAGYDEGPLFV